MMPLNIPPDLLPRAHQIPRPLVNDADEREALLIESFYLYDPFLYGIDRKETAGMFAVRCIEKLLNHGCLPEGEHSLARLVNTARFGCSADKYVEIDDLVGITNVLCGD